MPFLIFKPMVHQMLPSLSLSDLVVSPTVPGHFLQRIQDDMEDESLAFAKRLRGGLNILHCPGRGRLAC